MNYRFVFNQIGKLLVVLGFALLAVALAGKVFSHGDDQAAVRALLVSALIGAVAGGIVWWRTNDTPLTLGRREALLLVALSWIVGAALAATPYRLWTVFEADLPAQHPFQFWINCSFEAMSGLTTTGATILADIESIPRPLLLWRAFTQWLGGLGIVLLFVAVLPSLGVGGKRLFQIEAPGPSPEGVTPHIRETARLLWFIYTGLTLLQTLALWAAGMDLFESICHTFTTLSSGGFGTRNASVGGYSSLLIDLIVIVFMFLAGVNFALYHLVFRRRWRNALQDPEFRLYGLIVLGAGLLVSLSLIPQSIVLTDGSELAPSVGSSFRHGFFTTVSLQTTTGFCTANYDLWPFIAKGTLVLLMFVGGCSGSTAGGIKVVRIWMAFRILAAEIEKIFRPKVIRPLKFGNVPVDNDLRLATLAYIFGLAIVFLAGAGAIMVLEPASHECSFTTAATASVATLCTIGPGLHQVGAIENYGWFSAPSKAVMIVLMLMGRLELFTVIVLFVPRFWKGD